jgi:hypothetical protein
MKEAHNICACCMGPFPKLTVEEMEDEDKTMRCEEESEEEYLHEEGATEGEDECVDEGDHIFMTAIKPEEVDIHATGNFSQCLTEAYNKNMKVKSFHDTIVAVKFKPEQNLGQNENQHLKLKLDLYLTYSPGLNVNSGL